MKYLHNETFTGTQVPYATIRKIFRKFHELTSRALIRRACYPILENVGHLCVELLLKWLRNSRKISEFHLSIWHLGALSFRISGKSGHFLKSLIFGIDPTDSIRFSSSEDLRTAFAMPRKDEQFTWVIYL
jgi:hypothetical protein